MNRTYSIDGIKVISRALEQRRDFVSWANVWMFIKVLIAMEALYYSMLLPIMALVVAVVIVFLISEVNRY